MKLVWASVVCTVWARRARPPAGPSRAADPPAGPPPAPRAPSPPPSDETPAPVGRSTPTNTAPALCGHSHGDTDGRDERDLKECYGLLRSTCSYSVSSARRCSVCCNSSPRSSSLLLSAAACAWQLRTMTLCWDSSPSNLSTCSRGDNGDGLVHPSPSTSFPSWTPPCPVPSSAVAPACEPQRACSRARCDCSASLERD